MSQILQSAYQWLADVLYSQTTQNILANTADGADNKAIVIAGGGAYGTSRGAYLELFGNESAGNGGLYLGSGASTNNTIHIQTSGVDSVSIDSVGNMSLPRVGSGLQIKEGANAKMGTVALNGATEVTVSTTAVSATSRIFLTIQSPAGTPAGVAYVSSRVAGTSFGVKGIALDTSTVAWMIVEPA